MAFDAEQRGIRNGALAALLVGVISHSACIMFDFNIAEFDNLTSGKTHFALVFSVLAACLIAPIARLANHRFVEPLDRDAAAEETGTPKAAMYQAILRNTHEQVTFAALVYVIAAITLPPSWSDCITAGAVLFAVGRALFTANYAKGAAARAFGFALTFYPTVLLGLLSLVAAFV